MEDFGQVRVSRLSGTGREARGVPVLHMGTDGSSVSEVIGRWRKRLLGVKGDATGMVYFLLLKVFKRLAIEESVPGQMPEWQYLYPPLFERICAYLCA